MPQIFLMVAPSAQEAMTAEIFEKIHEAIGCLVKKAWNILESKVAFSVMRLDRVFDAADIQIQINHIIATEDFRRCRPFNPDERACGIISGLMKDRVREVFAAKGLNFKISVCINPFYNGFFKPPDE